MLGWGVSRRGALHYLEDGLWVDTIKVLTTSTSTTTTATQSGPESRLR